MNVHQRSLRAAVDAVRILSPTVHSWLGVRAQGLPTRLAANLDAETARGYLVHRLGLDLYAGFYCPGRPIPLPQLPDDTGLGSPELVEALVAANDGRGCWEPDWKVHGANAGELWVARGELRFRARSDQVRADEGRFLVPGVTVRVLHPKELLRRSPGFYMAFADAALPEDEPVVRLYWNFGAEGAVAFVAAAIRALNRHEVPARLKVVNHPAAYRYRCDAGVLYLPRRAFSGLQPLVAGLYKTLRRHLGRATPALTKPLAPGLGVAEDAGTDESFGLHRCALIADGLVRAHEVGAGTPAARADEVEACLVAHGVDPAAPYLAPGSADIYTRLEAAVHSDG